MVTPLSLMLLYPLLSLLPQAADDPVAGQASGPAVRFEAVDVYVDPQGTPLAAYQFEFADQEGRITIVTIEGSDHKAFSQAPYYDPKALLNKRVIIAAFSTDPDLPTEKTRVATVHVQVTGDTDPDYLVTLTVAASADGASIPATITISKGA